MSTSTLPEATEGKRQLYKQCFSEDSQVVFWDIVVLTAGNEAQKVSYQQQVELKKSRNEIPSSVRYVVFSDPPGAKIGNGGATMFVLQQLEKLLGWEEMKKAKILLLHAGGYSQRLASVSAMGKVFMALPCGEPSFYQMLEILLIMYADLPARMNPGVFIVASDCLLLYNGEGDWNMREPGVTALAHPAPINLCTNHGVFVFEDVNAIWKRYEDNPAKPASMATARRFLHKSTVDTVRGSGAVITSQDKIYVDLAYYFDYSTAQKLLKFYNENEPLGCEIDAYGDFLQALGPDATPDYCERVGHVTTATGNLVETRRKVFDLMRDTPFRAVVFNQAQFSHMGTTKEYLHHLCYNQTLIDAYLFKTETAVRYLSREEGAESDDGASPLKKPKTDKFESCAIICSQLNDRESVEIGPGTVVEYSILGQGVRVGDSCIVSGLNIPANYEIPDSSYLHTLPVTVDERTCYATFAFDIGDSMKTSKDVPLDLPFCQGTVGEALERVFSEITELEVWPKDTVKPTLWNARLFPAFPSRQLSSQFAIDMLNCLRDDNYKLSICADGMRRLSVLEMVQARSIEALLSYSNELQDKN